MRIDPKKPPRTFKVGRSDAPFELSHVADIDLAPDELVTFESQGTSFDVTRKDWGYYATTSLNGRLPAHGLRPALVRNASGKFYLMLVQSTGVDAFERYCGDEEQTVICWLDDEDALAAICQATAG